MLSDFFDLKDGLKIRFLFECCNLIGKNDRISFSFFEDVVLALKKVCKKECFDSNSVWFEKHAEDFVIICKKDKLFVKKYAKIISPLKKITPHKLRSTFGTNLYQETGDIYLDIEIVYTIN